MENNQNWKPPAMMEFVGTKIILATPMNRQEYNTYRGWEVPANELGRESDAGYLVEYQDAGPENHPAHKGYISWSPKDVFDRTYYPVQGLPFGVAVEALKKGYRVCRAGWNGKGMFLQYVDPYAPCPDQLENPEVHLSGTMNTIFKPIENKYTPGTLLPWIGMKTADNKFVPWLASQTDILATDWMIAK